MKLPTFFIPLVSLVHLLPIISYSQTIGKGMVPSPKPTEYNPINHSGVNGNKSANNNNSTNPTSIMGSPNNIYHTLNNNNPTLKSSVHMPTKQDNVVEFISQITQESAVYDRQNKQTKLIDLEHFGHKKHYEIAYNSIVEMLEGEKKEDLKKAIFLTENAYSIGTLSYDKFKGDIERAVSIISEAMKGSNIPFTDQNINVMVHKFMSGTISIYKNGEQITTSPKTYDFSDPLGLANAQNMFVTKLVDKGKGQCKSMPLLFLILVQELGGNAYLSFAPSHSFVKCKKESGGYYNVELTNGMLTSDDWIIRSGFIKAQAIRGGIYMDTLNFRQIIAHCLVDLATYYRWNFAKNDAQMGCDAFTLKCVNKSLEVVPNDIYALLEKSNYYTALLNVMAVSRGYTEEAQIVNDSETKEVFIQRNKLYALTDGLGYEYMPADQYIEWLNQLNHDAEQQLHQSQTKTFTTK